MGSNQAFPEHWRWRIFVLPEVPKTELTGPVGGELELGGRKIAVKPLDFPPSGQIRFREFADPCPALLLV